MIAGINYPWTVFQGKPNYGCDFGVNVWGSHAGVSAHADDVARDFEAMASLGAEVVRWFVFTDGRGGVQWTADGNVAGLADRFFDDMDRAIALARTSQLRLCLVLFDYSWMQHTRQVDDRGAEVFSTRPDVLKTTNGLAQILDLVVEPVLRRYGADKTIHSFDVINEPDWVTRALAFHLGRTVRATPFSVQELRRFVGSVSALVHRCTSALVTLGGAKVHHLAEWDEPDYGLDFLQVHSYPHIDHPERDETLIGRSAASFGVKKPVLIGEFPANGDRQHPADHRPPPFYLGDYLDLARSGGYLGAWPWSFKGVDDCGGVTLESPNAVSLARPGD